MKVLTIASGEIFGGAERQIIGLCEQLRVRGQEVAAIVFHEGAMANSFRKSGFATTVLDDAGPIRCIQSLKQVCAQFRTDVIHLHGYRSAVTWRLARGPRSIPSVITRHGATEWSLRSPWLTAKLIAYQTLECWATNSLGSFGVSVTNELQARKICGAVGRRTLVIYNGLDLDVIRGLHFETPFTDSGIFNFVSVGRLEPVKGLKYAVEAVSALAERKPAHLHIIGSGPEEPNLKAAASRARHADTVRFCGFQSDPYPYIKYADCLVMPSRHEGLPYTLLEAMALGTPVIASRVGGLAEVLEHERTALLVPYGDVSALAEAMARMAADAELRSRLARNALELVKARFTVEKMTTAYLELYEELLAPGASERT